jgi:ribosomal protein S18 acetylase RimI-like enzyme
MGVSRLAIEDKVATCERLYAERGLPTIFRLTPFAPAALDGFLARRGYRVGDEVEVRVRTFAPTVPPPQRHATGVVREHGLEPWLKIFEELSVAPRSNRAAHRAILKMVPGVRRLLVLRVDDTPVACGVSVLTDGLLGLFDLVTARAYRHQGYGSEMLRRALRWGEKAGAAEAYLQVLLQNEGARRIYERAGFRTIYLYHYREKY